MARWRRLEERVRHSKAFRGFRVMEQKTSRSTGKRPDFFGVSKEDPHLRIVGDAKYVKELLPKHVRQVVEYKGYPFFAQKGIIFIKQSTKVPKNVRRLARESNVRIIRRRVRLD
jgi:hypothetical protein